MRPGASAFNQFSLLIFRHASRRFLARSVMYLIYTPSRAHHAACLTNVPSCFVDGRENGAEWA